MRAFSKRENVGFMEKKDREKKPKPKKKKISFQNPTANSVHISFCFFCFMVICHRFGLPLKRAGPIV
jgi:hypothetical protein